MASGKTPNLLHLDSSEIKVERIPSGRFRLISGSTLYRRGFNAGETFYEAADSLELSRFEAAKLQAWLAKHLE